MDSFLRAILPDEWVLWLTNPSEDQEDNTQISLHLRESDYSLAFAPEVNRYEVVQFLKKVHDEGPEFINNTSAFKEALDKLFYLQIQIEDWDEEVTMEYRELFQPFCKQNVVFKGNTQLDVIHEKDDNGKWVTRLCKSWSNNEDELVEVACINTDPTFSYPPEGLLSENGDDSGETLDRNVDSLEDESDNEETE